MAIFAALFMACKQSAAQKTAFKRFLSPFKRRFALQDRNIIATILYEQLQKFFAINVP